MAEIKALENTDTSTPGKPKDKSLDDIYRSVKGADWNNVSAFKKGVVQRLQDLRPNQGPALTP